MAERGGNRPRFENETTGYFYDVRILSMKLDCSEEMSGCFRVYTNTPTPRRDGRTRFTSICSPSLLDNRLGVTGYQIGRKGDKIWYKLMQKETLEMWEHRHHPYILVVFLATKRVKRWLKGCRVTSVFGAAFQHLSLTRLDIFQPRLWPHVLIFVTRCDRTR